MNSIRWLQLSDIHFNLTNENCNDARKKLPNYLKKTYKNILDFIVICGDCTFQNKGYTNVKEYLDEFRELLKPEAKNNIFLVLGNHDIKRNIAVRSTCIDGFYSSDNLINTIDNGLYSNGSRDDETYKILISANTQQFCDFYFDITKTKYDNDYICKVCKLSNRNVPVNLILINTCLFSYEKDNDEGRREKLLINTREIKQSLDELDLNNSYNIMIGHHAIDCFDPECRKKFIDMLHSYSIDMYLCGHTHSPSNKIMYIQNNALPSICTGSLTSDGSDINVAIGQFDLKRGKGIITHYKWIKKEINVWTNANDIEGTSGENNWCYISKKFIENPFIEKHRRPFQNEINLRFDEEGFQIYNLTAEIAELFKVDKSQCCNKSYCCKCSEKEEIFCEIFSPALNGNSQSNIFSKEDFLLISVGILTYGFYRYVNVKNDSSLKTDFGRKIDKFLKNSRLTDVFIDILKACFDDDKFVKLSYEREIENELNRNNIKIQTKKIAVLLRFIDKVALNNCLLNNKTDNNSIKRQVKIEQGNMVYYTELFEENAFNKNEDNLSEYSYIIREIQKINDERMIFNSYFGHIASIDCIKVIITFYNTADYGFKKEINKIHETITSINYNLLDNRNTEELYNSIFYRAYPQLKEELVLQSIKEKKDEN